MQFNFETISIESCAWFPFKKPAAWTSTGQLCQGVSHDTCHV